MITFTCDGCGAVLRVADDKAGKSGKCPKCTRPFVVPEALAQPDSRFSPSGLAAAVSPEEPAASTAAPVGDPSRKSRLRMVLAACGGVVLAIIVTLLVLGKDKRVEPSPETQDVIVDTLRANPLGNFDYAEVPKGKPDGVGRQASVTDFSFADGQSASAVSFTCLLNGTPYHGTFDGEICKVTRSPARSTVTTERTRPPMQSAIVHPKPGAQTVSARNAENTPTAVAQKKTAPEPVRPHPFDISATKVVPAPKFQEFNSAWRRTVASGSPDEFLSLTTNDTSRTTVLSWNDVEPALSAQASSFSDQGMTLGRVYITRHIAPYIAFVNYHAPSYDVIAGGLINIGVHRSWGVADGEGGSANSIRASLTGTTPRWDCLGSDPVAGSDSSGRHVLWWPATWKADDRPQEGHLAGITQRWWIRVPEQTSAGSILFAASITVVSPWPGKANEVASLRLPLNIVQPRGMTREQLLCLWKFALDGARKYNTFGNRDEDVANTHRRILQYVDSLLHLPVTPSTVEASAFAATLRGHPEYREQVLPWVETKK